MKYFIAALLVITCCYSAHVYSAEAMEISPIAQLSGVTSPEHVMASAFECKVCIGFVQEALQNLIEIIANVGIAGGCSTVCGLLPSRTLATVCNLVCDIIGIEEFSKLLNEVDPDPIFICEKVDFCAHSTTAAANITVLNVQPSSGSVGSTFKIQMAYSVTNEIATGEFAVVVVPPDAQPFGDGETIIQQQPGTYAVGVEFKAQPSEQEPFDPGQYQVVAAVCEGSCGSKHEWSETLSQRQASFSITQQ